MPNDRSASRSRRPPASWMRAVARPVVEVLLRSPAHGLLDRRLMLVEYTGHRSGSRYRFPVRYYDWDGGAVLASTQHGWPRWMRRVALARVCLRGEWLDASPTVIEAVDEKATLLEEFVGRYGPRAGRALRVGLPADRAPTREEALEAAARTTLVLFRFTDVGF